MIFLTVVFAMGPQLGCGTLIYGRSQTVSVRTHPENATLTIYPSLEEHLTPVEIDLSRNGIYTLRITKEGYSPETVIVDTVQMLERAFIMMLGGIAIGGAVDLSTGAYNELVPSDVSIDLRPDASPDD